MAEGWIALYRQIKEHWIWKEKRKYSKAEAWIDILLSANHEDNDVILNGQLLKVKRGQFITSEIKLANSWGWDRKTVRRFLLVLERDYMLTKTATTQWTMITIEKYDDLQPKRTTNSTTKAQPKGQRRDNRRDTNKNDNNDNNENKLYYSEFVLMEEEQYQKLIERYGEVYTKEMIDRLNNYIGSLGKKGINKYKSHYHTILNWANKDNKGGKPCGKTGGHINDFDESKFYA